MRYRKRLEVALTEALERLNSHPPGEIASLVATKNAVPKDHLRCAIALWLTKEVGWPISVGWDLKEFPPEPNARPIGFRIYVGVPQRVLRACQYFDERGTLAGFAGLDEP